MKYRLDVDKPLPPRGALAGPRKSSAQLSIIETLSDMPTQTSFLVPLKGRRPATVRGQIGGAVSQLRQTYPERKFATRHIHEEKGIRVWRVR